MFPVMKASILIRKIPWGRGILPQAEGCISEELKKSCAAI